MTFHLHVCFKMASVLIPWLSTTFPVSVWIEPPCMWPRKLGVTVQLLNKAELFVSFCSGEMFWCLYHLRRQEPCLPLAFYWLREHYVAETSRDSM